MVSHHTTLSSKASLIGLSWAQNSFWSDIWALEMVSGNTVLPSKSPLISSVSCARNGLFCQNCSKTPIGTTLGWIFYPYIQIFLDHCRRSHRTPMSATQVGLANTCRGSRTSSWSFVDLRVLKNDWRWQVWTKGPNLKGNRFFINCESCVCDQSQ